MNEHTVLLALALLACPSCAPPATSAQPPQPPLQRPDPPATPPNPVDVETQKKIQDVLRHVGRMRELPILGDVTGRVIDRPTMLRQVKEQVRTQVPPEAIRGESAFLTAFGFIPEGFDYEAEVYRLIESQLAGYYDPDRKTLFLMDDLSNPEAEVTLAHELVHALQDQHYDLGPRLKYQKDANDSQAAVHCLAEGDATSLMLDYTLEEAGVQAFRIPDEQLRLEISASMALAPDVASFPRVLRESLLAPYVDGVLFVHALRRQGGWPLVDRIWRDPPTTTEQVLHMDKLATREPAEQMPLPSAPPGPAWVVLHTDGYGEQGLRIALEEWLPRRAAARAAAGWAGDRAIVWEHRDLGVTVAAWWVRFDPSVQDASREATEAFDLVASSWDQKGGPVPCREIPGGRHIALARNGRNLAFVAGRPATVHDLPGLSGCAQLGAWATAIASQK